VGRLVKPEGRQKHSDKAERRTCLGAKTASETLPSMNVMKRLILSTLGFLATDALANHLLHNVPADVGEDIQKVCRELWASSSFTEGWCVDQRAVEWIRTHPDASNEPPPEASEPHGVITLPGLLDQPKGNQK